MTLPDRDVLTSGLQKGWSIMCVLSTSVLLLCDGCLRMVTPVPGDLSFYLHQLTQSGRPVSVDLSAQQAREGAGGENRGEPPPRHPHPLKEGA